MVLYIIRKKSCASRIGFDYVNSDKWQMIISTYWPMLQKFSLYSELWYLTSTDFDELYPHLLSFKTNPFWIERQINFVTDFYKDKNDLHLIFYSSPYPDQKFTNQYVRKMRFFDWNFEFSFKDGAIQST